MLFWGSWKLLLSLCGGGVCGGVLGGRVVGWGGGVCTVIFLSNPTAVLRLCCVVLLRLRLWHFLFVCRKQLCLQNSLDLQTFLDLKKQDRPNVASRNDFWTNLARTKFYWKTHWTVFFMRKEGGGAKTNILNFFCQIGTSTRLCQTIVNSI